MRIAFLPNWCKYFSLVLFIASFITGIDDFRKGFEEGGGSVQRAMSNETNSMAQSPTHIEESKEERGNINGIFKINKIAADPWLKQTIKIK